MRDVKLLSPAPSQPAAKKPSRESEPLLAKFSLSKAAEYLDAGPHTCTEKCFACHVAFAYLAARPAISLATSAQRAERQALEGFAAKLAVEKFDPQKTAPLRVSETVLAAAVLAKNDAACHAKLHPLTRQVLDRIWDLQREDGGWNWSKANEPPSEIDDHFGVTMAAIGVGAAPDGYADTPQARKGLDGIRRYLREHPPKTMHQRGMLLLAAGCLEGLLTEQQCGQAAAELFALQRPDGGWSMGGLGDWKRKDGRPLDRTVSDGYGTGFCVFALRRGGRIAADDPRLQKGLTWPKSHQRASGCWFMRSPYHNDGLRRRTWDRPTGSWPCMPAEKYNRRVATSCSAWWALETRLQSRLARHQIRNTGSIALKFLCCCAPAYEDDDTVLD